MQTQKHETNSASALVKELENDFVLHRHPKILPFGIKTQKAQTKAHACLCPFIDSLF